MNTINEIKTETQNILRGSPRMIIVASFCAYLITSDTIALRFIGYFLITEFISSLLKGASGRLFPNNSTVRRPANAGNCTGCGTFPVCANDCIDVSGNIGMPSGHSMGAMMAATFWCWWIWRHGTGTLQSKIVRCALLVILALLVVISRTKYMENCHTPLQVTVGAILGVGAGTGFYFLENYYKSIVNK